MSDAPQRKDRAPRSNVGSSSTTAAGRPPAAPCAGHERRRVDAPGIAHLAHALAGEFDVTVAAPARTPAARAPGSVASILPPASHFVASTSACRGPSRSTARRGWR